MWATQDGLGPVQRAVAVAVGAALMFRRSAPTLMIVLAIGSAVLQVMTREIADVPSVLYTVLFYTAGRHPMRGVRFGALAVAVVGSGVAAAVYPYASFQQPFDDGPGLSTHILDFMGIAALLVGAWAIGFVVFQRRSVEEARVAEQIAELERRRVVDLYDEQSRRSSLARDMHDVVAHSLAVVVAQAEGARFALDASPEAAKDALAVIADTARQALADVRSVLEELRSTESAAQATRTDRDQLYDRMRAAGMKVEVSESGDGDAATPNLVRVSLAILTEALTNALKYGDLTRPVHIDIDWTAGCRMTVRNALTSQPLAPGGAGHGVTGMRERAELAGGTLTSGAVADGWLVDLHIPEGHP